MAMWGKYLTASLPYSPRWASAITVRSLMLDCTLKPKESYTEKNHSLPHPPQRQKNICKRSTIRDGGSWPYEMALKVYWQVITTCQCVDLEQRASTELNRDWWLSAKLIRRMAKQETKFSFTKRQSCPTHRWMLGIHAGGALFRRVHH